MVPRETPAGLIFFSPPEVRLLLSLSRHVIAAPILCAYVLLLLVAVLSSWFDLHARVVVFVWPPCCSCVVAPPPLLPSITDALCGSVLASQALKGLLFPEKDREGKGALSPPVP